MHAIPIILCSLALSAHPAETEVRQTIERSLPYIAEGGLEWIEQRDCVSCHRVGNMIWSLQAAQDHGFEVDDRLDEWTKWANKALLSKNDKGKIVATLNGEGVAQMLLLPKPTATSTSEFRSFLKAGQQGKGTWKPAGQLPFQKRPVPETTEVSTMWIAFGLARTTDAESTSDAVKKAVEQVEKITDITSSEWYVTRLLLALELDDEATTKRMVTSLTDLQKKDGSWGWLHKDPGDALATGMALYALRKAGVDRETEPIQTAVRFLISTQSKDGSWPVNGTKAKKQKKVEETSTYWGTTWAVLGLLETLPD